MFLGKIICPKKININNLNTLLALMNVYLIVDHQETAINSDIILCGMFRIRKNKYNDKISFYLAKINIDPETGVLTRKWRSLSQPPSELNIHLFWSEAKGKGTSRAILRGAIKRLLAQLLENGIEINMSLFLSGDIDIYKFKEISDSTPDLSKDLEKLKLHSELTALDINIKPSAYNNLVKSIKNEFSFFFGLTEFTQKEFIEYFEKNNFDSSVIKRELGEKVTIIKKHRYKLSNSKHPENIVDESTHDLVDLIADMTINKSYYFFGNDALIKSSKKLIKLIWSFIDNKKFGDMSRSIFYSGSRFSRSSDLLLKSNLDSTFNDYYKFIKSVDIHKDVELGGLYPVIGCFLRSGSKKIIIKSDSSKDIAKSLSHFHQFTTGEIKKIRKLPPTIAFAYSKAFFSSRNDDDKRFLLSIVSDDFLKKYPSAIMSRLLHLIRSNIFNKNKSAVNKSHYRIFNKWLSCNINKYREIGFAKVLGFWHDSLTELEEVIHYFGQNTIFVNNNTPYATMLNAIKPPQIMHNNDNGGGNIEGQEKNEPYEITEEDIVIERKLIVEHRNKLYNETMIKHASLDNDDDYDSDENSMWCEKNILLRIFRTRRRDASLLETTPTEIENVSWKPVAGDFKLKDYIVTEMNSFGKVYVESYDMRHCACSFARSCYSGEYIIFSAIYDGKKLDNLDNRRATIGINIIKSFNGKRSYSVEQVYAAKNRSAGKDFKELAYIIIKKLEGRTKK